MIQRGRETGGAHLVWELRQSESTIHLIMFTIWPKQIPQNQASHRLCQPSYVFSDVSWNKKAHTIIEITNSHWFTKYCFPIPILFSSERCFFKYPDTVLPEFRKGVDSTVPLPHIPTMTGVRVVDCWETLRFQCGRGRHITQAQMPRNGEAVENGEAVGQILCPVVHFPPLHFHFLDLLTLSFLRGKIDLCFVVVGFFFVNRMLRYIETIHWVISEHLKNFWPLVLSINFWSGRKKDKRRYTKGHVNSYYILTQITEILHVFASGVMLGVRLDFGLKKHWRYEYRTWQPESNEFKRLKDQTRKTHQDWNL